MGGVSASRTGGSAKAGNTAPTCGHTICEYHRGMWKCRECGKKFALKNQQHSCGDYSVKKFLEGKPVQSKKLFWAFVKLVRKCGAVRLHPAKTRVGFISRMTFAAVNALNSKGMRAHVVLPRRLSNSRFHRVDSFGPKAHVHNFVIRSMNELDEDVFSWVVEAFRAGS